MPVRKRSLTRRQSLSAEAQAWLDGDQRGCGFFMFKPDEELQALWHEYADKDNMCWHPKQMLLPQPIDN